MDDLRKELEAELQANALEEKQKSDTCYTCIALAVAAGTVIGHLVLNLITAAYQSNH